MRDMKNREALITPVELTKMIGEMAGFDKSKAKSLIFELVSRGELEYVDAFGRTCLIVSFSRPVRVSKRVVLKPPDVRFMANPGDVVVSLNKGIAFGRGTHPTTALCIRALTWLSENHDFNLSSGLDIGTGTGVLAVVASLLGVRKVSACDIEPVAIHEARENTRINHLESRVTISESCDFSLSHDLIMANLRYPTLISMHRDITRSLSQAGWLVLSGIKQDEIPKVDNLYKTALTFVRQESENGWASLVYTK